MREFAREQNSVSSMNKTPVSAMTHLDVSDWLLYSSTLQSRVWLWCKDTCLQPKLDAEFRIWWCAALNILIAPVDQINIYLNNIIRQFFVFKKLHSKPTWLKSLRGLVPPMGITPGLFYLYAKSVLFSQGNPRTVCTWCTFEACDVLTRYKSH